MAARPEPQTALDEVVVDDANIEAALEQRERAKGVASNSRKAYENADAQARGFLQALERQLGEGPVRVGRFVVELKRREARAVAFETDASSRVSIRVAKS